MRDGRPGELAETRITLKREEGGPFAPVRWLRPIPQLVPASSTGRTAFQIEPISAGNRFDSAFRLRFLPPGIGIFRTQLRFAVRNPFDEALPTLSPTGVKLKPYIAEYVWKDAGDVAFPVTPVGTTSKPVERTLIEKSGKAFVPSGPPTLAGQNADQFRILKAEAFQATDALHPVKVAKQFSFQIVYIPKRKSAWAATTVEYHSTQENALDPTPLNIQGGDPIIKGDSEAIVPITVEPGAQPILPNHRLLVCGDSDALSDSVSESIREAGRALSAWRVWAFLTPEILSRPGIRLRTLQEFGTRPNHVFGIYPPTLAGLRDFSAELAESREGSRFRRREKPASEFVPEPLPLTDATAIGDYVQELNRHYFATDPGAFAWLCATMLAPQIRYEITLEIGQEVERCIGPNLVTEINLLWLLRLPWFRNDEVPDTLRSELPKHLDQEVEIAVRKRLIELLSRPPQPPFDSAARDRFELERALQAAQIDPKADTEALRDLLGRVPAYVLATHPTLTRQLKSADVDVWGDRSRLYRWMMRLLFRHGLPRPALLRAPIPALLVLACLLPLLWYLNQPLRHQHVIAGYPLNLRADTKSPALSFGPVAPDASLVAIIPFDNGSSAPVNLHTEWSWDNTHSDRIQAGKTNSEIKLPLSTLPGVNGNVIRLTVQPVSAALPGQSATLEIPLSLQNVDPHFTPSVVNLQSQPGKEASAPVTLTGKFLPPFNNVDVRVEGGDGLPAGPTKIFQVQQSTGTAASYPLRVFFRPPADSTPGKPLGARLVYRDRNGQDIAIATARTP